MYLVIRLRSFQLGEPDLRGTEGDLLLFERLDDFLEGVEEAEDEEDSEDESDDDE